jgi:hypothetical protein
MNPRRRQRNGVRSRRPCVQNAGVIGRGLLVSPARRRLFTTAAKIADTFFLANAVMNDTMTQQDTDDTEKPPPCPWWQNAHVERTGRLATWCGRSCATCWST